VLSVARLPIRDVASRVLERRGSAAAQADETAFGGKRPRAGEPEPAARSRDNGNPVGEAEIHAFE